MRDVLAIKMFYSLNELYAPLYNNPNSLCILSVSFSLCYPFHNTWRLSVNKKSPTH